MGRLRGGCIAGSWRRDCQALYSTGARDRAMPEGCWSGMGCIPGFGVGLVWAENTFLSAKARERPRRTPFCPRRYAKSQEKGHSAGHPQGVPLRWDGPVEGNANGTPCHLARRSAGVRPGRTVASVSWGVCEFGHKAGTCGDRMGLAGRGRGWTRSNRHLLRISTPGR